MNITTQRVSPDDKLNFDDVIKIRNACWKEYSAKGMVGSESPPTINTNNGVFFLIKNGDEPVGIHIYYGITPEYYQCFIFYLIPEYRDKGVYTITYQFVVNEFKKLGAKRLSILVDAKEYEMIETLKNLNIEPVLTSYRYDYAI